MLVVELSDVILVHGQFRTDFLPDYTLGDDLVAQVLLEVFVRSALRLRCLLQFFHASKVHLLAHFVQLLDQFRVAGDAEVFPFLQQELLVNQIAENIALFLGKSAVGGGRILLL